MSTSTGVYQGLVLDGISIALSCTLRYRAVAFVRWNPWGVNLLERILWTWLAYSAVWLAQWLLSRDSQATKPALRSISPWLTTLLGRFDQRSPRASIGSLVFNTVFTLAALDFVYRGRVLHHENDFSFSRMGFTTSTSAKIVLRYPAPQPIEIQHRPTKGGPWSLGLTQTTHEDMDWVTTFILKDLQSDTAYDYRTNGSHCGSFRTMADRPKRWTMVSTSCILPFYPYSPLDHSLSIKGLDYLTRYLRTTKVDMMLFLGDFIYIDLPRRFGYETKDYQDAYRQVYASPSWSPELRSLPWIHAYDDHEITNNWSGNETGIYHQAIAPFMSYQHFGNPDPPNPRATYYSFNHGNVSIFVLDTRRYRSPSDDPDVEGKSMLGVEQLRDFTTWLQDGKEWKIVLSSTPFTRNYRTADFEDTWAGYLWERQRLLEMMWETDGVLILSGDRHEHSTTAFPPPGTNDTRVIEFSTSPLSQFVPLSDEYYQVEDSDVAIKHVRKGESKFGSITFDTSDQRTWKATFDLIVDGEKVWSYEIQQQRQTKP